MIDAPDLVCGACVVDSLTEGSLYVSVAGEVKDPVKEVEKKA